jgi:hypothetical protein
MVAIGAKGISKTKPHNSTPVPSETPDILSDVIEYKDLVFRVRFDEIILLTEIVESRSWSDWNSDAYETSSHWKRLCDQTSYTCENRGSKQRKKYRCGIPESICVQLSLCCHNVRHTSFYLCF